MNYSDDLQFRHREIQVNHREHHSDASSPASGLASVESGLGLLSFRQHTLTASIERSGVGLHSGKLAQVRILPTEVGQGRYFVRTDLPGAPIVPATIDSVAQTTLSTELRQGKGSVCTVEHLLAALWGLGVDNARIEIDGAEVPLLDGSALGWVEAIAQVGIAAQAGDRPQWQLTQPVWVHQGDAFVAALPAAELRFTYGIDFDLPAIGNQWYSWSPQSEGFATAIAPARTFGLAHQIEQLRHRGLIQGGSLENALVCGQEGWLNPPLRFSNEPVRHKLLDLVGDLSLLGTIPQVHVLAYKASHHLHTQLVQHLMAQHLTQMLPSI
ncbi:MAG: UDP-3-O-acyl-N-acetylglucosamine deacetylase [Elainellaceae cyanobacterium]